MINVHHEERELFEYIEIYYNCQRLHATPGYVTPSKFGAKSLLKSAYYSVCIFKATSKGGIFSWNQYCCKFCLGFWFNMKKFNLYMNDEVSLLELVRMFLHYKYIVFTAVLLSSIISYLYVRTLPLKYQSISKFTVSDISSKSNSISKLVDLTGLSLNGSSNTDISQYLPTIVKDYNFIKDLTSEYWNINEKKISFYEIYNTIKDEDKEHKIVELLRNDGYVNLSFSNKENLYKLITEFESASLAYQVNAKVLENINKYLVNYHSEQLKNKSMFIRNRIDIAESQLIKSEKEFVGFKKSNISSGSPEVLLKEKIINRNLLLNEELYIQLRKQYEIVSIEESNRDFLPKVILNPEIPLIKSKPNKKMILLNGTVIGLIIGLAIVFILNLLIQKDVLNDSKNNE